MLSDAERRVLAELERALDDGRTVAEGARGGRLDGVWRSPARIVLSVLGVGVLVLLSWGAGSAVVALAAAGGLAWSTWRVWPLLASEDERGAGARPVPGRRPGRWTVDRDAPSPR
ncbi:DUF3040 domain-containing protein [Geodermatophilus sp. SYSU D00703]